MIFILIFITTVNISFWIFIFSKLSVYSDMNDENQNIQVDSCAILISIKNEEENLKKNIYSILNQIPHRYEVIIVDDYSTDNSIKYLKKIQEQYPFLKIIENKKKPGKKHAITCVIDQISETNILFTDADCFVKSEKWAQKMFSKFNDKKKIVLGYSPYVGNDFLNKFIRFETFMAALQYFSYAIVGIPYMGVGRNMAIEKNFFLKKKGYENHLDLKSGNDDLFVNENSSSENTAIQLDQDTFVYSLPPKSLSEFLTQKTRHVSTSFRYKLIHKLLLGLYSMSHILFYVLVIYGLFCLPIWIPITIWLLRLLIIAISTFSSFQRLKEDDLFLYLPILDFLMFVYYTYIGFYYYYAPKNKWK